jgi:hypothetical protein
MSFVQVSNQARTVVTNFLSDNTLGFNATLATICGSYGITPFTINFAPKSKNFFTGYYAPKDLVTTSNISFPLMCLYTIKSANNNQEKFHVFSGSVMIGLDTYIGFPSSAAPSDPETLVDAVEDTLYNLFNSPATQHLWTPVSYNGDVQVNRGVLTKQGPNWLQLVRSMMTFDINVG